MESDKQKYCCIEMYKANKVVAVFGIVLVVVAEKENNG